MWSEVVVVVIADQNTAPLTNRANRNCDLLFDQIERHGQQSHSEEQIQSANGQSDLPVFGSGQHCSSWYQITETNGGQRDETEIGSI